MGKENVQASQDSLHSTNATMWKHVSDAAKKKAEQRWAVEKAKSDNAKVLKEILFIQPKRRKIQAHDENRSLKFGSFDGSSALQNTDKEQWKQPTAILGNAKRNTLVLLMPTKSTRPRQEGAGHKPSPRSHYCKRDECYNSLQSCAQIHSYASSILNSRCKGGSGERMGKTEEKFRHGS